MSSLDWSQFTLEELRAHRIECFRQGGGSRPDVLLIKIGDSLAILKDQTKTDKWFSLLIAPILVWRECKALTQLEPLDFIPTLLHKPSKRSFLMSYHPSQQISKLQDNDIDWATLFSNLEKTITQMHQLGVAHNDLRNPTNILLTKSGDIVLVDLAAAFFKGKNWNLLNRWVFNTFCQVDFSAVTKAKQRFAPKTLHHNDIHAEHIAGKNGMRIRALGQCIRKLSRKLFTDNKK